MKQKKEHPGMECSYKSRSPHNFSRETRKGLPPFWPPRGVSGTAGFPHPVAPARERLPPPLAKTNRFGYLLKQIKSTAFFGYLIKTHNMPLYRWKEFTILPDYLFT
jgi:hypothetical protein